MYWRIVKPLSVGTGDSDSSRWAAVRATPITRRRAGVVFCFAFFRFVGAIPWEPAEARQSLSISTQVSPPERVS